MRFDSELIEAIGNPVYLKDREGRFIYMNRAWEQFYGIKREDAIGKRLHDVFPSVAADTHAAHDAALFSWSGPRVYELTVRGGDGEMHDTVHYKSVFSRADGSPAGVIGNFTDITSLKKTENALRLSELQMRLISDNVPALIAYFDTGLLCSFCNKAYAECVWQNARRVSRHTSTRHCRSGRLCARRTRVRCCLRGHECILSVDYLKIDGTFIRNIYRDTIDLAMVESINHIGHIMGKQTIAEFVEDDATIALLRKIGVDCAQGYGIGAPKPMHVGKHIAGASDSLKR